MTITQFLLMDLALLTFFWGFVWIFDAFERAARRREAAEKVRRISGYIGQERKGK